MNDRFKFRIPMFTDKGTFMEFQYVELGDEIECSLCGYNGEPQQSTGLQDKNGKLVYEGDVINIWCKNFTKNQISEVKFCKERAAFTFDYITDFGNIVPCTMDKTEIEVIGNIYENKELLNEI